MHNIIQHVLYIERIFEYMIKPIGTFTECFTTTLRFLHSNTSLYIATVVKWVTQLPRNAEDMGLN